jgi:hypothetical protein
MTDEHCQRYLEDPEANAAHLAECEACRALAATLEAPAALEPDMPPVVLDLNALPLAPWEGASHRPWGLILSLASGVFLLAVVVCFAAGTSITKVVTSSTGMFDMVRDLIRLTGDAAPHAPVGWRIAAILLFFGINGLLVVLLRRSPRGIDA